MKNNETNIGQLSLAKPGDMFHFLNDDNPHLYLVVSRPTTEAEEVRKSNCIYYVDVFTGTLSFCTMDTKIYFVRRIN